MSKLERAELVFTDGAGKETRQTVYDFECPGVLTGQYNKESSIASFAPNTRMAVYCSTKAYVMSLSRCMRSELKRRKINVIAVCPGPMDTEFLAVADIEKGTSHTFDTLPRVKPDVIAKKSLIASKKHKAVYTNLLFYKFYRILAKLTPHALLMPFSKT